MIAPAPAGGARRAFPAAYPLPDAPLAGRTPAVSRGFPRSARHEIVLRGAIDGLRLPESRACAAPVAAVRLEAGSADGALRAVLDVDLERTLPEPADFGDLRNLWGNLRAAARATFRLAATPQARRSRGAGAAARFGIPALFAKKPAHPPRTCEGERSHARMRRPGGAGRGRRLAVADPFRNRIRALRGSP